MGGFMQAAFFFGYNLLACYAFFLMLGTVGWCGALGLDYLA
jgi:transmembrane 9 superfamily member 1